MRDNPAKLIGNRSQVFICACIFSSAVLLALKRSGCRADTTTSQLSTDMGPGWYPADFDVYLQSLRSFSQQIEAGVAPSINCDVTKFGDGWGAHILCNRAPAPDQPCNFYSFGISTDYSFDTDLATRWNCTGFAADPTIVHPSLLHSQVTFHSVAAKMLTPSQFTVTSSMPALKKWLGHDFIDVLKMDCEGCEYSLAKDVWFEEPDFFNHVGQFAVEMHTSRAWLKTQEAVYSLGRLFYMLDKAGLVLQDAEITGCARIKEEEGCMEEVIESGFPCGVTKSCHNYLFARSV